MKILGIDVGGTGIKGAPVETATGELLAERVRIDTPRPATPEAVAQVVTEIVRHFQWSGPVGCGFPGPVRRGVVRGAVNLSPAWMNYDADTLFEKATGCEFHMANDADVAGLAEMQFGAGRGRRGLVFMVTLGTGIGTALFNDGVLVPNLEFGHIEIDGRDAEELASARVRKEKELSWKKWAERVDRYLGRICYYLCLDLIIVGGGVSKKHDKFLPLLTVDVEVVPAELKNDAGIIGAALFAAAACAGTGPEPSPAPPCESVAS